MAVKYIYELLNYDTRMKELVEIRKKRGVTQKEVADKLHCTPAAVSRVESLSRRSTAWLTFYEQLFGGDAS